jgi:hypothetical protein
MMIVLSRKLGMSPFLAAPRPFRIAAHILWIECTRCARKGRYSVAKLLAQHGHRGNMSKWVSDLRGDCHKRNAAQLHERRDLICPDLLKAL